MAEEPAPSARRPNTTAPTTIMTMQDRDLMAMTDEQLIEFADRVLSIVIPWGTKRTTILTRIVNSAMGATDSS